MQAAGTLGYTLRYALQYVYSNYACYRDPAGPNGPSHALHCALHADATLRDPTRFLMHCIMLHYA